MEYVRRYHVEIEKEKDAFTFQGDRFCRSVFRAAVTWERIFVPRACFVDAGSGAGGRDLARRGEREPRGGKPG